MADDGGAKPPKVDDEGSDQYDESEIRQAIETMEGLIRNVGGASQITIFCLKTVLVLNGGALIALMGTYSDIASAKEIASELAGAGRIFLYGLIVAGITTLFAYGFQFSLEEQLVRFKSGEVPEHNFITLRGAPIIIISCHASFWLFVWGGFTILDALEKLPATAATGG